MDMPSHEDVPMILEGEYRSDPALDDIELEGIDLQDIVNVVQWKDIKSIPLEHIQRVHKVLHKDIKVSLGSILAFDLIRLLASKNVN